MTKRSSDPKTRFMRPSSDDRQTYSDAAWMWKYLETNAKCLILSYTVAKKQKEHQFY